MDKDVLWSNILDKIKKELSSLAYNTWFSEMELYCIDNGVAKIIVPYAMLRQHIINNYKDLIDRCFFEETGNNYEIELLLKEEIEEEQHSIVDESIKEEGREPYQISNNLSPKYTFDNFAVGNSNRFAHAASLAVAEDPGRIYNPLFIYGNSGLGKTHLMHAIGNYIVSHSNKRVLYITSEQFVTDFVSMNRKDDSGTNFNYVEFFKQKYRDIDVLIIDDIQFLGGATESQKEFFHTFNTLYEGNKQIIISSDSSPNDLKKLEDRLKTRFGWGLAVDIYPPDLELRAAILRRKIVGENITKKIPEDVIQYIAATISGDVRKLEGALTRLIAYSYFANTGKSDEITLELAKDALKDYATTTVITEKNDVAKIQKVVADYFKIQVEDLVGKKRSANIAFPRQIAMYLCRKLTDESFPKIGMAFGGKDHSTVMFSCDKIEKESKTNKELAKTIDILEKEIH